MHSVYRDVHVQMVRVVVHDAHPLVVRKAERLASTPLDLLKHLLGGLLPRGKRQHQVIGRVPCSAVASLGVLHLEQRALNVAADAVAEPNAPYPLLLALAAREVRHEAAEAASRTRCRDLLRDPGSPLFRSARRTTDRSSA